MAAAISAGILPRRRHSAARSRMLSGVSDRPYRDVTQRFHGSRVPDLACSAVAVSHPENAERPAGRLPHRGSGGCPPRSGRPISLRSLPVAASCKSRAITRSPPALRACRSGLGMEVPSLRVAIRMPRAATISDSTSVRRWSTPRTEKTRMPAARSSSANHSVRTIWSCGPSTNRARRVISSSSPWVRPRMSLAPASSPGRPPVRGRSSVPFSLRSTRTRVVSSDGLSSMIGLWVATSTVAAVWAS